MASSTPSLLFVGLPSKTFIGIDLLSFDSSPNFHRIINIPPGPHFLYSGTDASLAIRHGHWFHISKPTNANAQPQILVWQWDTDIESLILLDEDNETALRAKAQLPHAPPKGLLDYHALLDVTADAQAKENGTAGQTTQVDASDWAILNSHISKQLLRRILTQADKPTLSISSVSTAPQDTEHIPGLSSSESASAFEDRHEAPLTFLAINLKNTWPSTAVGRERTDAARDRSWYLGHLIDSIDGNKQIAASQVLGELQFCYLMVLTLANYSCLEQWKRLLSVLLTCRSALNEVEEFFVEAIKVLWLQLQHCEDVDGGLFEFKDEGSGVWLKQLLKGFKKNLDEVMGGKGRLAEEVSELEDFMREKYGWEVDAAVLRRGMVELDDGEMVHMTMDGADEDDEEGEYAPIIVEV